MKYFFLSLFMFSIVFTVVGQKSSNGGNSPGQSGPSTTEGTTKPKTKAYFYNKINEKLAIQDYQLAETFIKEAIEVYNQDATLYFLLGQINEIFWAQDNNEFYFREAVANFEKSSMLGTSFDSIYSLGVIYFNRGVILYEKENTLPDHETEEIMTIHNQAIDDFKSAKSYFLKAELINPNDELLKKGIKSVNEVLDN